MSLTSALEMAKAEPVLPERDCRPISLLGVLTAENHKLLEQVARLQRETAALRAALQCEGAAALPIGAVRGASRT